MKRLILFATVAAMFCYPGVAVAFPEQEARCGEVPGLDVNQCTGGGRAASWSELPPSEITWGGGEAVALSMRAEGLSLTSQSQAMGAAAPAVVMAQIPAVLVAADTACMTQKI